MPGLDVYESLSDTERDEFLAALKHWGTLPAGTLPQRSLVNTENNQPLILAVKAGKLRYPAFKPASGPNWIILEPYEKEGDKRDKVGDRAIEAAVKAKKDYDVRSASGTYYDLIQTGEKRHRTSPRGVADAPRPGDAKSHASKAHKRPGR